MSEKIPPQASAIELDSADIHTLSRLKERRREAAESATVHRLQSALYHDDAIRDPHSNFGNASAGFPYDIGIVSYGDLVALDGLGVPPRQALGIVNGEGASTDALHIDVADEHIRAEKYGHQGLTLHVSIDSVKPSAASLFDNTQKSKKINDQIIERYKKSPAHQALHDLANTFDRAQDRFTFTTDEFSPNEDILATLDVLSSMGFIGNVPQPEYLSTQQEVGQIIDREQTIRQSATRQEQDHETSFSLTTQGLTRTVKIDNQSGGMTISFAADPLYGYTERANQALHVESAPFLETKCAEELLGALDSVGLMPHPNFQNEMIRVGEADRYGGVYTQMSREIAKWVDRDERRRVRNLFVPYNPETHAKGKSYESDMAQQQLDYNRTEQEIAAEEAFVREQLLRIDESNMSEPAKLLFRLAKQSIMRDASREGVPELPVTSSDVSIENGACFDVAGYYLGATAMPGELKKVQVGNAQLLEKTYGSHTFMLQQPAILNGVELPLGTLMTRGEDGGWAMQRLTPFCFEIPEDQLATGSELAKAYENERHLITHMGLMAYIVASAD